MPNTDLASRLVPAIREALILAIREQPELSLAELAGYKDHFLAPILSTIRVEELIAGVSSAGRSVSRKRGRPKADAAPAKSGRGRRGKRPKADDAAVATRILGLLKDAKGPMRSEHLRNEIGGTAAELRRVLDKLRADGKVKRKGTRRGTSYELQGRGPRRPSVD